jgi:MoaA/NifB/PqqE/SkfB family radical SAM enzyme
LERKNGLTPPRSWQISTERLDQDIDYAGAESMGFRGGEPMLSDQTWYVLQKLVEANNTQCFINFTTNGSVSLNAEQKKLISKFTSVTFNFSIDGIGKVFEYLRYPLLWTDLESNIKYCRDHDITVTASYTISNLNVLYHSQTVAWFDQNQIAYSLNPVYNPVYFRPGALPKNIKDQIRQQNQNDTVINALLDLHSDQDDQHYQQFLQNINRQDQWKGICMSNYLPELALLLG